MARTPPPRSFRRILHASDFSPASRPAFRASVALARARGADLLLVHVLPPLPMVPDVYVAATLHADLQRGHRAVGRRRLDRLVAAARAAGARARGVVVDSGVPAREIVRLARSRRADLIVMGTHGRTGLTRALLGSVAARVLATAACPVLTVRT
jgi:nucleotide-binding universal stress UspA family protein